jgi:hypothetical protein
LIERNIISIYNYNYDQFSTDELVGSYFGNLLNTMRDNTAFPLFDHVSKDVIKEASKSHLLDFGNANPEVLRHAGVATNILMTLPTLKGATVDEILSFKNDNMSSLIGFRKAIFDFSEKINSMPWNDDFQFDCLKIYSTDVAPKVEEFNEISSETSIVKNFGKKVIADSEMRKKAGYLAGGIAVTVLTQAGLVDGITALKDIFMGISLITISPKVAEGFLKSLDLMNKTRDEIHEKKEKMNGNTMYYYYKALKEL